MRRGFKSEANRIAVHLRAKLGLGAIDPFDPAKACAEYEIELIPLSTLGCAVGEFLGSEGDKFSALTVARGHRIAIVHNDSHHVHRQRSNICYELAHCFLGHEHEPAPSDAGRTNYDAGVEGEANFLAGCLLLPNEAAIHTVRNRLISVARVTYGVSQPMLNYRLRVSGAHVIHRRKSGLAT